MQPNVVVARVHRSWLAEMERRLLTYFAKSLPRSLSPNHLTALGLLGAAGAGVFFVASVFSPRFLPFAALSLALNWFGDSLDGTLARYRGIERPRSGFFLDHSVDVLAQILIFFGLGLSPYMRFDVACLALLSYWLAALYSFIRAVAAGLFQISYFGIGPTEIRLGLIAYTVVVWALGPLRMASPIGPVTPIDIIVPLIFATVFLAYVAAIPPEARRLAALDALRGSRD
jgi:phosphatidylglycerophosphate synthase